MSRRYIILLVVHTLFLNSNASKAQINHEQYFGLLPNRLIVPSTVMDNSIHRLYTGSPQRNGTANPLFVVDGRPFVFVGGFIPGWHFSSEFCTDEINEALIRSAKDNGINVLHLMLPGIESSIGVFDEQEFLKLDRFINSASKHGVYVMPEFISGVDMAQQQDHPYFDSLGVEAFIKNNNFKQAFKNRINYLLNHKNVINGVKYSEDPTILSWILITEPISAVIHYPNGHPDITLDQFNQWIEEMCVYVKTIDTKHLMTIFTTAAIGAFGSHWDKAFEAPSLDFLYLEDADMRIVDYFHYAADGYPFRFFSSKKTIVMGISFTSGAWANSNICDSLDLQVRLLGLALNGYIKTGATGSIVQSWGSALYPPIPEMFRCFNYCSADSQVCDVFKLAANLTNTYHWPSPPLRYVRIDPVSSDVSSNKIPKSFSLNQNYPNPFNPTTTIEYHIAEGGFVSLKVYDVLGQEVAALFEGECQPGRHVAAFNGHNCAGGVYLYRLTTNTFVDTKKLVLMK
jgi:hypothetical protein